MAIPSLAMIPSGYKDGKVYSVLPSNGDGDFTFSRGSNATRVNKDGLIETMPLELGSELITNGGFDTDSDWNKATGITISGGSANFTGVSGQYLNQNINFVSGKVYEITFNVLSGSGALTVFLGGGNNVSPSSYVVGENKIIATGGGSDSIIYLGSAFTGSIDNVSVKEVLSGYDLPRLDYSDSSCPSLLLEPQSTNQIISSENLSDSSWSKTNAVVESNSTISPDGTLSADKLTFNTSGNFGRIVSSTLTFVNSVSFFIKYIDLEYILIFVGTSSNGVYVNIKEGYATSTVLGSGLDITFKKFPNDWLRIEAKGGNNATGLEIYAANSTPTYNPVTLNGSFYLWGCQAETNSYATSYIPTNGTIATRLADVCNDAGTSDTFNDSEGVLMAEISALADDESGRYLSISNVGNYQIRIGFFSGELYVQIRINGSVVYSHSETVILTNNNKISIKYTNNTQKVYINGYLVNSETVSTIFPLGTLTSLRFNNGDLLGGEFYGNTKQIQYYNSALTDSELEELTSWESFLDMAAGQNYTIK